MKLNVLLCVFVAVICVSQAQNFNYNQTQLINQFVNRTGERNQNRTQWIYNQNQSQIKLQILNNTLWNNKRNSSKWNSTNFGNTRWNTSYYRPRRSDPKWVSPYNVTWNKTTHNGDIIIGQIGYLDRLLFNKTYKKERRWWSGREKIIEYPKDLGKYGYNKQQTITAIRIYNKFLDGLESKAKILSGGVGFRYVKIELSSPWNRGFEYLVQLFGR